MRERVTKLLSVLFITSSLLVALFPFYFVSAESDPTYINIVNNQCYLNIINLSSGYSVNGIATGNDVRAVILMSSNNSIAQAYFISESSFNAEIIRYGGINNSCPVTLGSSVQQGNYYYYNVSIPNATNASEGSFPLIIDSDRSLNRAIYYTFGEGAVGPEPEINHGDLIIEGYKTDIAGQGEASINNIDHILWNGFVDTNGNDISNLEVRLQIVPGTYTSDSKAHLLEQTYEDLIIDINSAHEQVYDASLGEVSFKWSDIVNMLNITPYKLWSLQIFGVDWQKEGWIYRIRLEDSENEYVGNWQTIYSSTSSGVENDLTIINNNSIDQT